MDIEQLRLILETIESAGEGAMTLGILWFVTDIVKYLLGYGVLVFIVVFATRMALKIAGRWGESVSFLFELREIVGVEHPVGRFTHSERNSIREALRRGMGK